MGKTLLSLQHITKIYPDGVVANSDVSIDVEEQTIHAIVGENGAGKTTLMNILFGITMPLSGSIHLRNHPVTINSPHKAIGLGIGMVHQHFMLAPGLTVAENIVMGVEPRRWGVLLDRRATMTIARAVSQEYGLEVPVERPVAAVPIGIRQRVEILKALYRKAELLIMDEPTSTLTFQESKALFEVLQELKRRGKTIVFISHKLKEVKQIADRITVMRDGTVVDTRSAADMSEKEMVTLMVGRPVKNQRLPAGTPDRELLTVEDLHWSNNEGRALLRGISFSVRAGEVVGVAGVEGNGQSQLVRLLTGLLPLQQGQVLLKGQSIAGMSPRQIRALGLCHIPEDRMENGAAAGADIAENVIVDRYHRRPFSHYWLLDHSAIRQHARTLMRDFDIRAQSPTNRLGALSGGNIQKAVVARELSAETSVVIASHPTRGIDVGAEMAIHDLLHQARNRGRAIFLVSADIDEILKLSTRIIVLYNGQIVARFNHPAKESAKTLGPYMLGVNRQ